jgi:hypothetical protein
MDEVAAFEIDVAPLERERLAEPKAGRDSRERRNPAEILRRVPVWRGYLRLGAVGRGSARKTKPPPFPEGFVGFEIGCGGRI